MRWGPRAHRRRQLEERLTWGEAWDREDGSPLHPQTLCWHLRQLAKETGVPVTHFSFAYGADVVRSKWVGARRSSHGLAWTQQRDLTAVPYGDGVE